MLRIIISWIGLMETTTKNRVSGYFWGEGIDFVGFEKRMKVFIEALRNIFPEGLLAQFIHGLDGKRNRLCVL